MPISSGALGWPESYFRKPEVEEDSFTRTHLDTAEGQGQGQTVWTVQLADRDQFERWKEMRDKSVKKKRRKIRKQMRKEEKKERETVVRNDINAILRRRRRCRFCLLTWLVTLVSTAILLGSIYLFTFYLDEDDLTPPPPNRQECHGTWRTHFLAYQHVLTNGTTLYHCCFMPDINASARAFVLQQGDVWPAGYIIQKQDCTQTGNSCEDFEKKHRFDPGTPSCQGRCLTQTWLPVLCLTCTVMVVINVFLL